MTPPGLKQLLQFLTMRIRKELSLLGQERKERRWDGTPPSPSLEQSGLGFNLLWEAFQSQSPPGDKDSPKAAPLPHKKHIPLPHSGGGVQACPAAANK